MTEQPTAPTLSHEQARRFYDRFGAKQDRQSWYERRAIDRMCANARLEGATSVVELGCGTGKLAERLLEHELRPSARYLGFDLSATMVALAQERTTRFGRRAAIHQTEGGPSIDVASASADRFLSCYVLDLLAREDIRAVLSEAARLLTPGGLLCTCGLTLGTTPTSRLVSHGWAWLQARRPSWVGGCRPIQLAPLLSEELWSLEHSSVVTSFGIPSEVLVARRR